MCVEIPILQHAACILLHHRDGFFHHMHHPCVQVHNVFEKKTKMHVKSQTIPVWLVLNVIISDKACSCVISKQHVKVIWSELPDWQVSRYFGHEGPLLLGLQGHEENICQAHVWEYQYPAQSTCKHTPTCTHSQIAASLFLSHNYQTGMWWSNAYLCPSLTNILSLFLSLSLSLSPSSIFSRSC